MKDGPRRKEFIFALINREAAEHNIENVLKMGYTEVEIRKERDDMFGLYGLKQISNDKRWR
jgi:hypothetical protein